jgi:hypothetical protein
MNLCVSNIIYCNCRLTASSCLYDMCAQCYTKLFARRRALHPLRLTNEDRKMQSDISNPPSLPPKSHALCKLRHKQNLTYAVVCLHKIAIILEQEPDVSLRPRGEYFYSLASDIKNIYNFRLFTWGTKIDRHTLKMGAVCLSETLAASVTTA